MGVFDNELILPGTITEIVSDYSYGYDMTQFGTTDSVTVVGTAFNGPVGQPVEIYSPEHARYIFGASYDYATRREATLVAEIQDAWDRGCRTIYAVRLSGKEIYKDFTLIPETKLKLRVAGRFPSNENKDIYMVYDNTLGASKIHLYKPATRATIEEKMQGLVESEDSILIATLDLSNSYGYTRESRLVDLLRTVNDHASNNVLKLTVIDENGNDVTIASKEAQALSVGALFPGAYFVGRDANKGVATTDLNYVFATDANRPYENFDGKVFKKLTLNSDVNAELPIYGPVDTLNKKFAGLVSQSKLFDFLAVPGKVDLVFAKDKNDYEEVELTDFELYQRLGSGFATTAKAEYRNPLDPSAGIKVKETPVSDDNRIQPIKDGVYSMMQNLRSDYRVLASGVADAVITGKLPKKEAFKIASAKANAIFDGLVVASANVKSTDMTRQKKYSFALKATADGTGDPDAIKAMLYLDRTVKRVAAVAAVANLQTGDTLNKYAEGTLFLVGTAPAFTLYRYSQGALVALDNPVANVDLDGKLFLVGSNVFKATVSGGTITYAPIEEDEVDARKYVLVESGSAVSVYEVHTGTPAVFEPVGGLDEIFGDNEDKTLVSVQSEYEVANTITIQTAAADYTTLEEFVEILNEDKDLGQLFTFTLSETGTAKKDEYLEDLGVLGKTEGPFDDKIVGYDLNLYIPYKTTDNFARHLAQHCTYTSLKTAPTHGIMGCSKLLDVNLTSIAKKAETLVAMNTEFYAKKDNGKDMLAANNTPYPIGRNISIVFGQYVVNMGDGSTYISNGASGYAGMVSVLPADQSSTSQPINIPTPMFELNNFQLERLTQKGFVTFKQSYTRGFVVTDGVTMAPVNTPFRRLSVSRIVNVIEELIREATEPYIGQQNHLANRNSMQTSIKSNLSKIQGRLIESFDFKIGIDGANIGIIDIDYSIVPIYEIREVRNRISVKDAA